MKSKDKIKARLAYYEKIRIKHMYNPIIIDNPHLIEIDQKIEVLRWVLEG